MRTHTARARALKEFGVALAAFASVACGQIEGPPVDDGLPVPTPGTGGTLGAPTSGGTGGKLGTALPADCDRSSAVATRPGPCSDSGLECGVAGSIDCGSCGPGQECFQGRCYQGLGAAPDFIPPLMRGLYAEPEGSRCTVGEGGRLERVDAALWDAGVEAITMDVYAPCGGMPIARVATSTLPGWKFPVYDGIHGEMRSTTFVLDPPVMLDAGDPIAVMFHAEGSAPYSKSAVSGIAGAVEPSCSFGAFDGTLYGVEAPGAADSWDYMARLYLH